MYYICGVIISVRRELNFERVIMVVMRMRMILFPHCTIDLRDNSSVGKS